MNDTTTILTRYEEFAKSIATGVMANPEFIDWTTGKVARLIIAQTDELLKQLSDNDVGERVETILMPYYGAFF